MADEPEHKTRSRELVHEMIDHINAAEVQVRNILVLQTKLGCPMREMVPVLGALTMLEEVSKVHEQNARNWEVVDGVRGGI